MAGLGDGAHVDLSAQPNHEHAGTQIPNSNDRPQQLLVLLPHLSSLISCDSLLVCFVLRAAPFSCDACECSFSTPSRPRCGIASPPGTRVRSPGRCLSPRRPKHGAAHSISKRRVSPWAHSIATQLRRKTHGGSSKTRWSPRRDLKEARPPPRFRVDLHRAPRPRTRSLLHLTLTPPAVNTPAALPAPIHSSSFLRTIDLTSFRLPTTRRRTTAARFRKNRPARPSLLLQPHPRR